MRVSRRAWADVRPGSRGVISPEQGGSGQVGHRCGLAAWYPPANDSIAWSVGCAPLRPWDTLAPELPGVHQPEFGQCLPTPAFTAAPDSLAAKPTSRRHPASVSNPCRGVVARGPRRPARGDGLRRRRHELSGPTRPWSCPAARCAGRGAEVWPAASQVLPPGFADPPVTRPGGLGDLTPEGGGGLGGAAAGPGPCRHRAR